MFARLGLIGLAVVALAACGGGDRSPSNGDVKKIVESELQRTAVRKILTGDQVVTNGESAFDKREISAEEFREVEAWERLGLIKLTASDVTWQNRGALPATATKKITVTPTEEGAKLSKAAKVDKPEEQFLYGRFYTPKVKSVIENREVKKDVDLYRVVKGTVENRYSDLGERFADIHGDKIVKAVKVVVLLKYDSFNKGWKLVTLDVAEPDKDFQTNRVISAIGQ